MYYDTKKHVKSAWVSKNADGRMRTKPWGHEFSWGAFDGIHGKTLFIKAGFRTSLKYHLLKSEVLFIRSGEAEIEFGDELSLTDPIGHPMKKETAGSGASVVVQSGSPYRIKALTDCEIIEIGNNLTDSPIRIEDDYGREKKK